MHGNFDPTAELDGGGGATVTGWVAWDDIPATTANLSYPHTVALTPDGGYLIVDTNNFRIRKVSAAGIISTVAGDGTGCSPSTAACGDGGPATSAHLSYPENVSVLADARMSS